MSNIDPDLLLALSRPWLSERNAPPLSPAERVELVRIANGLACKESATLSGIASETVRARRKRMYKRLHVSGALEVSSSLLHVALGMLARGERLDAAMPMARPTTPASEPMQLTS